MKKKIISVLAMVAMVLTVFTTTAFADYYTSGKTLSYGMSGSDVVTLQEDLKALGYFTYPTCTGYFGSVTKQSVVNYQKAKKLAADGIVGPATRRALKTDMVIKTARKYLGVPYVWGGTSPSGFDCSGFTHYVMLQNEIAIPRTAADQYTKGTAVSRSSLKPGDFVFFETYKAGASHVGIYLGNDQFIHASSGAGKIIISNLFANSYYSAHYIGAKRMI
ncbi:MAG: NlpC/P60 family protein [Bacillota bacterium]